MSTHFTPIKPAPASFEACSHNNNPPHPPYHMFDLSTINLIENLTVYERNLLLRPPYVMTIPLDNLLNPRKSRSRTNSPPRPQNAWVIFRKDFENRLRTQYSNLPHSVNKISKMASKHWSKLPRVVKQYFEVLSKLALLRHKAAFPGYRYRPKGKQQQSEVWVFKNINKSAFVADGNNHKITYGNHGNDNRLDKPAIIGQQQNLCLESNANLHNSINGDVECDRIFVDTGFKDVLQDEASDCNTIHPTIYSEHFCNANHFCFATSQRPAQMPPFYSLPDDINIMGLNGKLI
ncbi:7940_t:CDS:1 [Paraglomus occultum]|uniref:7940_t:CDS:1 n=1 Tax=Paraglomus occultum TaxID=144539 RepID=A0A9N9CZB2_9GLOM|nr:7940_t:CDS:1 [Paraglomus occultum]